MSTEARLRELGIDLPNIPPPIADGYVPKFAPWARSGDHISLSGRLAKTGDQLLVGKVGGDITLGIAKSAARDVAIELLGVLKTAVGDLDHVCQVARMLVMVNGAPGFNEPHRVADGASELLVEVFGERGLHARSALVASDLPFGAAIEIDLVVEVASAG
ncbi:RidA family protein [Sphingomonas sp.]|uniref:RidA family protein n=1 Tax=Sphingomonas sp. TaxID=28214 RepID=UPI0038AAB9F5